MTRTLSLGTFFALIFFTGCSSSNNPSGTAGPTRADNLQEVGGMISLYSGEYRRGPAKVADLAKYEHGYPLGFAALKSGDIVVVWGATMAGEGGGGSGEIVAYEKKAATEGGAVLLQNGQVKQMSAAEFAAAPKAKK